MNPYDTGSFSLLQKQKCCLPFCFIFHSSDGFNMGNFLVGIRDTMIATENGFGLDFNLGFEG